MTHASNIFQFPVIPRNIAYEPSRDSPPAIRVRLKDIIDTAYDGLLNQKEADALARIDQLLLLSVESPSSKEKPRPFDRG